MLRQPLPYDRALREIDRLEYESGILFTSDDMSIKDRTRRLLNCANPPIGSDRDLCFFLLSVNAIE